MYEPVAYVPMRAYNILPPEWAGGGALPYKRTGVPVVPIWVKKRCYISGFYPSWYAWAMYNGMNWTV